MKPETEQTIATLEVLTDGLSRSCVGTEPYGIIPWENEEKGEFSFLNFLLDVKALTPLEVREFRASLHRTESENTMEQYEELIKLLESNLLRVQFYSYSAPYLSDKHTNMYAPYQDIHFPVIIGFTPDGEWLGMTPRLFSQTKSVPQQFAISSRKPTETTAHLRTRIEAIAATWKVVVTSNPSNALEKVLNVGGYIDVFEINKFWNVDWLEEAGKYYDFPEMKELKIKTFFERKLIDGRVYYLYFHEGEYQVHYVLGKNKNGDWFGVFTDTFSC